MTVDSLSESFFRFGSLSARLRSNDRDFASRFCRIFHDCVDPHPDAAVLDLEVFIPSDGGAVRAEISNHDESFASETLEGLFPELNLVRIEGAQHGQLLACASNPGQVVVQVHGNQMIVDHAMPWQMLIAHYFLHHVMRSQPGILFFHGATIALGDAGVLLSGGKGAGKSTLSLALAARGHAFLGDEHAALCKRTGNLLPFRRAASIRLGPQAEKVRQYFSRHLAEREILPDGTERLRASVSAMFPSAAPRSARLTHAFFLDKLGSAAGAAPFEFSAAHLRLLAPLHATVMNGSAGQRAVTLLNIFGGINCYMLSPGGSPDETAGLVEAIVEGRWDTASRREPNASAPSAGSRFS